MKNLINKKRKAISYIKKAEKTLDRINEAIELKKRPCKKCNEAESGTGLPDDVMDDIIAIMDDVDLSNISSPGPDGIDGVHFNDDASDVDGATTVYAYATEETYAEMRQLVKRFAAKVKRLPEISSVTVKRDIEPQTGNIRFNIVIKL